MDKSVSSERPYRSHKIRACDYCRRRKQRCMVAAIGTPCRLCSQQKIDCSYEREYDASKRSIRTTSDGGVVNENQISSHPNKRAKCTQSHDAQPSSSAHAQEDSAEIAEQQLRSVHSSSDHVAQSTHIIGPVVSEDAHVLEKYMSPATRDDQRLNRNPYNVYSSDPQKPVLYTKVDKRRAGLMMSEKPGLKQKIIMDQILSSNIKSLLKTYLEKLYPCFPIIDRVEVEKVIETPDTESLATLLCTIYAISLICWNQADGNLLGPCPDQRFFWNLSVKALSEDFLAPGLSTLQAVLIDLAGRPSYSITGNVINNGRAVALANSLGLNRDSEKWNISVEEKQLRTRVWWGVLIHDIWGSYTYGTPPCTDSKYYDVPIPKPNDLMPCDEHDSKCFIAFCRLTEILGRTLPLLYNLHSKSWKDIRKVVRSLETDMEVWEEDLPDYLKCLADLDRYVKGSSNLHLAYLALRMLVCRLSLHAIGRAAIEEVTPESLLYQQSECKRSALAILDFVRSLKDHQLTGFWLPYGSYHLTAATTLLLRFAVETTDDNLATSCITSVREFVRHLQDVREKRGWDLGTHCLAQCEAIVERITNKGHQRKSNVEEAETISVDAPFEFENPVNWLDTSLLVSFGELGGSGQERDLWELLNLENVSGEDYIF